MSVVVWLRGASGRQEMSNISGGFSVKETMRVLKICKNAASKHSQGQTFSQEEANLILCGKRSARASVRVSHERLLSFKNEQRRSTTPRDVR